MTDEEIIAGLGAGMRDVLINGEGARKEPFAAMSLILDGLADYRRKWFFGRKRLVLTKTGLRIRTKLMEDNNAE